MWVRPCVENWDPKVVPPRCDGQRWPGLQKKPGRLYYAVSITPYHLYRSYEKSIEHPTRLPQ